MARYRRQDPHYTGKITGELTNSHELGVVVDDAGHMEKRNEWLVGGLDQQELEGVTIEGDAFEGGDDTVHDCATSDCGRDIRNDGYFHL